MSAFFFARSNGRRYALYNGRIVSAPHRCRYDHFVNLPTGQDEIHFFNDPAPLKVDTTRPHHSQPEAPRFNDAHSCCDQGNALTDLERYDEAIEWYRRALSMEPGLVDALLNLGFALLQLDRHEEARACYEQVLAIHPADFKALTSCGFSFLASNRKEEALSCYQLAVASDPFNATAHFNLGFALQESGRHHEALTAYDRALAIKPGFPEVLSNRGTALDYLARHEEALQSYDAALSIEPAAAQTLINRGSALQSLRRFDEALACYGRVQSIRPDYADAHWNESICRLMLGDFKRGWQKYEWGWKNGQRGELRKFAEPLWLGQEPLSGKTILLHAEQGLGDTLQFCRYANGVASLGACVILEVQHPLKAVLADLEGVHQVLAKGSTLPAYDYHCPMLSLPLVFSTRLETIPARVAYIRTDPVLVSRWEKKLGVKRLPRVGLVWSGRAEHFNDHNRSIPLAQMADLITFPAQFVSLQKEVRHPDQLVLDQRKDILSFFDHLADFADTAALIELMDIVITVDTSVAHLAGAMGKSVWVLLARNADWRWLLDREDSPWYPSARLFRQQTIGDWTGVIRTAADALKTQFALKPGPHGLAAG